MKRRMYSCSGILVPALLVSGFAFAAEDSIETPPSLAVPPVAESLQATSATAFQETRNTAADARFNMDTRSGDTSEAFEAWLRERGLTVVGDTGPSDSLVAAAESSEPVLLASRQQEACQGDSVGAAISEAACAGPDCLPSANETASSCQSAQP